MTTKKTFFLSLLVLTLILSGLSFASSVLAEGDDVIINPEPIITPTETPVEPLVTVPVETPLIATSSEPLLILNPDEATTTASSTASSTDPLSPDTEILILNSEPEATSSLPIEEKVKATSTPLAVSENVAPVGEIIYPLPDMSVSGNVPIKVRITDQGSGLNNILFYLSDNNGTPLGEASQPDGEGLYTINWDVSNTKLSPYGPHYLYVAILGPGGSSNSVWVPVNFSNQNQNLTASVYTAFEAILKWFSVLYEKTLGRVISLLS
jgi:hypothetical protein